MGSALVKRGWRIRPSRISAVPAMASDQSIFGPHPSLVTIGVRKASRLRARPVIGSCCQAADQDVGRDAMERGHERQATGASGNWRGKHPLSTREGESVAAFRGQRSTRRNSATGATRFKPRGCATSEPTITLRGHLKITRL